MLRLVEGGALCAVAVLLVDGAALLVEVGFCIVPLNHLDPTKSQIYPIQLIHVKTLID